MYSIDSSVNFKALTGKELEQLCIGSHEFVLNFRKGVCIEVRGLVQFVKRNTVINGSGEDPKFCANLISLLGLKIEEVVHVQKHELTLVFSGGLSLVLIDDTPEEYESITITTPDWEMVI